MSNNKLNIKNLETKIFSTRNLQFLQDIKNYKVPTVDEELLLFELAKGGDESAKNTLFMGHQRFIYSLAKQYSKNGENVLDYVNEGNIGMSIAFNSYNPTIGVRFITYASNYIRREMNAYLNKTNNIVQQTNKQKFKSKVKKIKESYFKNYGVYPTVDEIITQLHDDYNISVKERSDIYDLCVNSINIDKDDDNYNSDVMSNYNKFTSSYNTYEDTINSDDNKYFINEILKSVKTRDANIVKLLFGIDCDRQYSADEVADKYDITTANVNNIKNKVIEQLKNKYTYRMVV